MAADDAVDLGVTGNEVASHPALLIDLGMAYIPRRLALCQGLTALLGDNARAKLKTRWDDTNKAIDDLNHPRMKTIHSNQIGLYARELAAAVARLEDSIWGLTNAKLKVHARRVGG